MSAWDDPAAHIRALERRLAAVEALVRAAEYAASMSLSCDFNGNKSPGWVPADQLRAALEGR